MKVAGGVKKIVSMVGGQANNILMWTSALLCHFKGKMMLEESWYELLKKRLELQQKVFWQFTAHNCTKHVKQQTLDLDGYVTRSPMPLHC